MEEEILLDINYPDEDEMKAAQLACCGRACKECETPVAYAWRKREVDMALLLEFAIENELTENEKDIVTDRWYDSLSYSQIAEKRNISASTARVTSERAISKQVYAVQGLLRRRGILSPPISECASRASD